MKKYFDKIFDMMCSNDIFVVVPLIGFFLFVLLVFLFISVLLSVYTNGLFIPCMIVFLLFSGFVITLKRIICG